MAKTAKLADFRRSRNTAVQKKPKSPKARRRQKEQRSPSFATQVVSTPPAMELMRDTAPPIPSGSDALLQSGVLAFRRKGDGEPLVLLISKKRSKKWGIPKGRVEPHLSLHENAAKEAFEEAGVIGHLSPSSVGVFRAEKASTDPARKQMIEVWVYLLEVTETLADWPEKKKRATRWVSCEVAARHLREPVLTHLCHRLAQS